MRTSIPLCVALLLSFVVAAPVPQMEPAWPSFGGDGSRNNVNRDAKNLPVEFNPDEKQPLHLLWKAELGSRSMGQPVIAHGRILIGTNNENPRNPQDNVKNPDGDLVPIDKGILMCFEAATGKFLWQAAHDRLPKPINDRTMSGINSTPTIDGKRAYYISNRCELVCVDLTGTKQGTEAVYHWKVDLIKDYKVFPHIHPCAPNPICSPLIAGDTVFIITGNGVGENLTDIPSPDAPSFMAFDKMTGNLIWKDNSPGKSILHGQWSSPAYADTPVPQVIFPGGDGWIYALEPKTGKLLWKFDGNPKGIKYDIGGVGERSYFVAMPVIHGGKLFLGTGQHPEHFTGVGHLWCIDLARAVKYGKTNPDSNVSPVGNNFDPQAEVNKTSALHWHYGGMETRKYKSDYESVFGRTVSNVIVVNDVVYAAELAGFVHCLDARTGKRYWKYDTQSVILSTPLYADGKVYLGVDDGDLVVFNHQEKPFTYDINDEMAKEPTQKDAKARRKLVSKELAEKLKIRKIEFDAPVRGTPTAMGDILYITTEKSLYAFRTKK